MGHSLIWNQNLSYTYIEYELRINITREPFSFYVMITAENCHYFFLENFVAEGVWTNVLIKPVFSPHNPHIFSRSLQSAFHICYTINI
jgi:hypothetical protein